MTTSSQPTSPTIKEASPPLVIGLTGNIGTGKSTVLAMLAELGALTIDADQVAHHVMEPGQPAHGQVIEAFGPLVVSPTGSIDRQLLGQIVFADAQALARLEAIVHPAVFDHISQLLATATGEIVVIEAIKLLEAGFSLRLCDRVWVVTAPREQQVLRLMATRGLSREQALLRINAQPPQADKVARADVVIDNGESLAATRAQVEQAWRQLRAAQL